MDRQFKYALGDYSVLIEMYFKITFSKKCPFRFFLLLMRLEGSQILQKVASGCEMMELLL